MSNKNGSTKKGMDSTVTAALIGVIGTIIVTVITVFANRQPATPQPPTAVFYTSTIPPTVVATDTVPAGESTSTPEPVTSTPGSKICLKKISGLKIIIPVASNVKMIFADILALRRLI